MQQGFPWIAQQNWEDILFIHTPVPASVLQEYVPAPFTIDTYNGQGWLTLVLFRATNSRFRYFPSFLSYPKLNQMNLRTYVTFGGESRSEEHTSELQSRFDLVCRLLLEKKNSL